jgi:hypothetical protein
LLAHTRIGERLSTRFRSTTSRHHLWRIQARPCPRPAELTAWPLLANLVFNLDEVVTKG